MKKKLNKKLLNLIALCSGLTATVAVGIGGIVYSLQEKSADKPIDQNVLPDSVYNIDDNGVLLGFKDEFLNDSASPIYKDNFKDCHTMEIPARVTSINECAFAFYNQLVFHNETTIPDFIENLTFAKGSQCSSIGNEAFSDCSSLTSVSFPNSLTQIDADAFYSCESITSIDLSNTINLNQINDSAFYDCDSLTSVDLSNTAITALSNGVFYSCTKLNTVILPNSLNSIGGNAFLYDSSLTSINISNCLSLNSIGGNAFQECSSLTSISFPSSLKEIGGNAFYGCTDLNKITWESWNGSTVLPYSNAFSGVCPNGGTVTVTNPSGHDSDELLQYLLNNGGLPKSWAKDVNQPLPEEFYNITGKTLYGFKSDIDWTKYEGKYDTIQIPDNITHINAPAFSDDKVPVFIKHLTTTKNSALSWINPSTFTNCSALTSISFKCNPDIINTDAFKNCSNLSSITWDAWDGTTSFSKTAFANISSKGTVKVTNPIDDEHDSAALLAALKNRGGLPNGWTIG